MDKRALWSKILASFALVLMVVGFALIAGGGRRVEYGALAVLGIIIAAAGAIVGRSSFRKLVLWGAGVAAAAMTPGFLLGLISGLRGKIAAPDPHPVIIAIAGLVGFISQIAIFVGTIGVLLGEKRPEAPPMGSGAGQELTGATPSDTGNVQSAVEIKRVGRKKSLVWGVLLAAVPLLVIGIFLMTKGGEKADQPLASSTEGPYIAVGSTREEVLRIQGSPTFKLEMVWFYDDSQVQFDSDGKVAYLWNNSKNLKLKPEKRP